MADWQWGSDKKAVALTEEDIKAVINRIIEAVTKDRASDLLEQFKQFARVDSELAMARAELSRKDSVIADLHARIATLNGFVQAMTHGGAHSNGVAHMQMPLPSLPSLPSLPTLPALQTPDGL